MLRLKSAARKLKGLNVLLYVACCVFLIHATVVARADIDKSGLYVNAVGGLNWLGDQDIEATIAGTRSVGTASFSQSYLVGFSVGYRFANNWAIEEEVVFRRTVLDSANLNPLGNFNDGNFENTQLSAKALYHFPLRANDDIEAYLGVGIAWLAELDFDLETPTQERPFEQDQFGIELHAGVRYYGWKHAFAGAGVRYLSVSDTDLPSPSDARDVVRAGYDPLSLALEFGWRF